MIIRRKAPKYFFAIIDRVDGGFEVSERLLKGGEPKVYYVAIVAPSRVI